MSARHAVYWAPEPEHTLWPAGCAWLGRDPDGAPGAARAARGTPWRYGFHATLKAPMHLADGHDAQALDAAVAALAATTTPFPLPALQVTTLDDFIALRPSHTPAALQALADRCVRELDGFRRPPTDDELERRRRGLDAGQRALLQRWGYPHVFARWRFHLTLSDALDSAAARAALQHEAAAFFAPALAAPLALQSICLFEEPAPGQPMRLRARHRLGGAVPSSTPSNTREDAP